MQGASIEPSLTLSCNKQPDDGVYLQEMDLQAWPSSYYGRTRRIDLQKFYCDILVASSNELLTENHYMDRSDSSNSSSSSSSSSSSCTVSSTNSSNEICSFVHPISVTKKKVSFSTNPPTIFEYEPEYENTACTINSANNHGLSLFDEGWPGRAKSAMKSAGFIDFKSKIEAKLSAINDASLVSQLESISQENEDEENSSSIYRGYYRNRKSPLVQHLNLRPVPNQSFDEPSLMMDDDTPSPSLSYMTDSPTTPKDGHLIPILSPLATENIRQSTSTTSNNSILSPGGSKWLKSTLSRMRSTSRTK